MNARDYDGVTFQITPVRGIRAFNVDSLGRLRGIHHRHVWRPGENVAECKASSVELALRPYLGGFVSIGIDPSAVPAPKPKAHDMAKCTCGFYGFLDGSADYHDADRVEGVVEAYGDVHLGTRGFRASKARIVALCLPEPKGTRGLWGRFVQWHADYSGVSNLLTALGLGIAAMAVIVGLREVGPLSLLATVPMVGLALLNAAASLQGVDLRIDRRRTSIPDVDRDAIRRNYGGVPIYTSRAEMLHDFPTDEPEHLSPEHDGFWEVEAR